MAAESARAGRTVRIAFSQDPEAAAREIEALGGVVESVGPEVLTVSADPGVWTAIEALPFVVRSTAPRTMRPSLGASMRPSIGALRPGGMRPAAPSPAPADAGEDPPDGEAR